MKLEEPLQKLHYIPVGVIVNTVNHVKLSPIPGFRGLTSWGDKTYAVFRTPPSDQIQNELRAVLGGRP